MNENLRYLWKAISTATTQLNRAEQNRTEHNYYLFRVIISFENFRVVRGVCSSSFQLLLFLKSHSKKRRKKFELQTEACNNDLAIRYCCWCDYQSPIWGAVGSDCPKFAYQRDDDAACTFSCLRTALVTSITTQTFTVNSKGKMYIFPSSKSYSTTNSIKVNCNTPNDLLLSI